MFSRGISGEKLDSVRALLSPLVFKSTLRTNQTALSTSLAQRKIHAYCPEYDRDKFEKLVAFGPNYRANAGFWQQSKEDALDHVLGKSECSDAELKNKIRSVVEDAKAAYNDDVLQSASGDHFIRMMAEDSCYFLLLTFSILGDRRALKFPEKHLVFGAGYAARNTPNWIESMFFVGNQVPFVAIQKVMELRYFQEAKATIPRVQPLELAKRTLYKFLMLEQDPYPVDLIHCLQSVILGTASDSVGAIPKMLDDIEAQDIPSALQLSNKGVKFKRLEGDLGSVSIHYRHSGLDSVLYLPVFRVDAHTELVVDCIRKYEILQREYAGIEPKVSSFFQFLKELAPTTENVEVLSSQGIILGETQRLPMLLRSHDFDCRGTSAHLCSVRKQIREDRPVHWPKFKKRIFKFIWILFSCLMLLFTYLQLRYTILGYNRG